MELITQARNNSAVDALYKQVESRGPVTCVQTKDSTWASETVDNATTIYFAPTKRPAESLMHELLHAKLKLDGYKQYSIIVTKPENARIKSVVEMLDNELQHHKMFADFIDAGFSQEHFYSDADIHAYAKVRRQLERMKSAGTLEEFLTQFVTIIAPGGQCSDERSRVRTYFTNHCPPGVWKKLLRIEEEFSKWRELETLDVGGTLVEIIRVLDGFESTWIGRSMDFPSDGRFIGDSFSEEEAVRWHS